MEFSTNNMKAFNEIACDDKEIKYTSFGAKRKELQLSVMLRANYEKITDHQLD